MEKIPSLCFAIITKSTAMFIQLPNYTYLRVLHDKFLHVNKNKNNSS